MLETTLARVALGIFMNRLVLKRTSWLLELISASDQANHFQWTLMHRTEKRIVASSGDTAKCVVQRPIFNPILLYKRHWPYDTNTTTYVVCRMSIVLSGDRLRQDNGRVPKSGHEVPKLCHCPVIRFNDTRALESKPKTEREQVRWSEMGLETIKILWR